MFKMKFSQLARYATIVLLIAMLLTACGGGEETAATEGAPTEIPRQVPSLPRSGTVVANGQLEPVRYARLSSDQGGEVIEILVQEGQQVTTGDLLLRLRVDEALRSELANAEYERLQAQQALDDLNNNHQTRLTEAKDAYAKARQAQYDAERKASYQAADSPTFVKQQADLELEVAKEKFQQASDRYELLKNGPDPVALEAAQARLKAAEERVSAAQAAIQARDIKATINGTVAQVNARVGETVGAGQVLVTIGDFSEWRVVTSDLNEIEVVKVSQGQGVSIVPDALQDIKLTGTVQTISSVFEERAGDVIYRAVIVITETVDPRVRWGMTVAVTFEK